MILYLYVCTYKVYIYKIQKHTKLNNVNTYAEHKSISGKWLPPRGEE